MRAAVLVPFLPLIACTGADPTPCQRVEEDTVQAADTVDTAATAPIAEEVGTTVSLTSGARGYVDLVADSAGTLELHVDTAGVVVTAWRGEEWPLPTPTANSECAGDLPEVYTLDLEAGSTVVEIGPADVESVWMLLTRG